MREFHIRMEWQEIQCTACVCVRACVCMCVSPVCAVEC